MSDVFVENNAARGVSDRAQRIAFWVSLTGLVVNTILFALYVTNDSLTPFLVINYVYYTVTISIIAWSAYRNWHFMPVLSAGIAAIYFHMWGTTFVDAWAGNASVLSFPTLLFVPLCMILIAGPRVLTMYATAQAFLVYCYMKHFGAGVFGFDPERVDTGNLATLLAVMSGITLFILAIVSYSRRKTDNRLLRLVRETERLAAQDPLTGLKNRRAFMEEVDALWANKAPFSVVFIDLDRFKPLNDEYGHAVGDSVLQTLASRLQDSDAAHTVARFGGDEFALLIEEQATDKALDQLVKDLYGQCISEIDIEIAMVSVGASFGYAQAFTDAVSVSELLHAADTAMMRCKASGGGVEKFDSDLDDASFASGAVEELFRKALQAGQIKPALQPIVDAHSLRVIGHELLARWSDSGLARTPSPMEFIPIAEKLGLLNEVLWVTLKSALSAMKRTDGFLAINVSPSQLSSSSFVETLQKHVEASGFSMDRIELEITEHVAFRNLEDNIATLAAARALGCKIVLDDFGSGYSSLSLLEELPLDKVKLDKSLQASNHQRGVLPATIRLARDLGFECCVEGIESEDAADFAASKGCRQMQGFWFGHPEIVSERRGHLKIAS